MVKVQDLTADTSPTGDDLIFGTNNPGGTPGSRKWTLDNTLNYLLTRTQTWTGVNTFSDNIILATTKKLFLDGGINTSIRESAADTIAFELNGIDRLSISPGVLTTTIATFDMNSGSVDNLSLITSDNPNIGTDTDGFIRVGNSQSISWRNAGNTANAKLEFSASDEFSFIGGGIQIPTGEKFWLDGGSDTYIYEQGANRIDVIVGGAIGHILQAGGTEINNVFGKASALATTATNGFVYLPSTAGTPTGVPTAYTGKTALVYDSTNNILYANDGVGWSNVGGGGANVFGNGWDGSASNPALSASGVLVKHYTDLTISSPTTWSGTGVIIVKVSGTLNLTSTLTLTVDTAGTAGSAGGGGVAGGVGGKNRGIVIIMAKTITGTGTITSTGNNGANGSNGGPSNTTGTNGGSPSTGTSLLETSVTGATGGIGSTGSTGANGGTGSGTVKTGFGDIYQFLGVFHKIRTVGGGSGGGGAYGNSTGAGGGGGGGGASSGNFIETGTNGGKGGNGGGSFGGGGGAGGGGGGNAATLFLITSSVSAINVTLTGGTGGNGGDAYQFGDDTAGGGGGGAGGCVEYVLIANSNATINETLTGGTGGSGGALRGSGQNGTAGTTGNIQKIYLSYDSFLDLI